MGSINGTGWTWEILMRFRRLASHKWDVIDKWQYGMDKWRYGMDKWRYVIDK